MTFEARGRQYRYDTTTGHIEQIDAKPYRYDASYSAIYDTEAYVRGNEILQALRLGYVIGAVGNEIEKGILDMGYGNGAFLRQTIAANIRSYGFDVTDVPVPDGALKFTEPFFNEVEVVTFWDCFEHIPLHTLEKYLEQMKENKNTICISLPNCDVERKGLNWFENEYFHLKPDEHLRHFSASSLQKFMEARKFEVVADPSYHEDVVRSRGYHNILTMAFR